jgi:hypothetical protein
MSADAPGPLDIVFTQFLRPDGRRQRVWIERPADIVKMAHAIEAAGGRFEIESLTTGDVSMTVEWGDDWPVAIAVCPNGPPVVDAVDRLVREAAKRLTGEAGAR